MNENTDSQMEGLRTMARPHEELSGHFVETLTKRQLVIGAAFVPLYCFGWISLLYTKPLMLVINHFFALQKEQQTQISFLMISFLYVGIIVLFARFFKMALKAFGQQWIRNTLWIILGFGGLFLLSNLVIPILMSILHPLSTSSNQLKMQGFLTDYPILFPILVVIIGPVIEEIVYRVIVFRTIRRKHRVLAYLVSSFLFGFQHVYEAVILQHHYTELWNIIPYSATGLFLCYLYEKKRNILVPLGTHVINNGLGVIVALFI